MKIDIQAEIDKDSFRKKLTRYTWRAFGMIPKIESPIILDIGCGTGIPTIDLAVLSKGKITAIDIDKNALKKLKEKITALRLSSHIKPIHASLQKIRLKKESFDIVWAEGSVAVIGFEQGLKEWNRLIKPNGYLVIHDEQKDYEEKMKYIPRYGYSLLGHFQVSDSVWLDEYFLPLKKRLMDLQNTYKKDGEIMQILARELEEIHMITRNTRDLASIFYVMQKG